LDALVVLRQQPGEDAVLVVEVVPRLFRLDEAEVVQRCGGHGCAPGLSGDPECSCTFCGVCTSGVNFRSAPSDFTYASSLIKSSSFTCPWNVGMIGEKPLATFAVGFRIDSRM